MTEAEELKNDSEYIFRPYVKEDIPFIQRSWGDSYYNGVNGHKLLSPQEFHKKHRPIRESFLERPTSAVIVCASSEDPNLIMGWCGLEKPISNGLILHYIYVKHAFKGLGLGYELLKRACPERPVLFTHKTVTASMIMKEAWKNNETTFERFIFTPHLV